MIPSDIKTHFELYEGIFFDLDGTLVDLYIDWNTVRLDIRAAFLAECSGDIPETGINNLIHLALERGCTNAREIAAKVLDKYESSSPFDPIQNVTELFQSMLLRKKIAVVTNNLHSTAKRVLKSMSIFKQGVCIVGFDDVQHSKPDPEGILFALQELCINKDEAVMIGDRDSDKKAAYNAQVSFFHVEEFNKYM